MEHPSRPKRKVHSLAPAQPLSVLKQSSSNLSGLQQCGLQIRSDSQEVGTLRRLEENQKAIKATGVDSINTVVLLACLKPKALHTEHQVGTCGNGYQVFALEGERKRKNGEKN